MENDYREPSRKVLDGLERQTTTQIGFINKKIIFEETFGLEDFRKKLFGVYDSYARNVIDYDDFIAESGKILESYLEKLKKD